MQKKRLRLSTRVANRLLPNTLKKRLKFARARLFEAFGSQRYSRPAMYGMEAKLEKYLGYDGGCFIECGANDGYAQSNTYYLSRFRGWSGLLVEPVPRLYDLCRAFRPDSIVYNCALGAADGGTVEIIYADLMSTAVGARPSREQDLAHAALASRFVRSEGNYTVHAPVRSLSSLLDEVGVHAVDLFVLDVEGFEMNVLAGVDFAREHIKYILVETTNLDDVSAVLAPDYLMVEKLSHHDYLFERRAREPASVGGAPGAGSVTPLTLAPFASA